MLASSGAGPRPGTSVRQWPPAARGELASAGGKFVASSWAPPSVPPAFVSNYSIPPDRPRALTCPLGRRGSRDAILLAAAAVGSARRRRAAVARPHQANRLARE